MAPYFSQVIRMVPYVAFIVIFWAVYNQMNTNFVTQGMPSGAQSAFPCCLFAHGALPSQPCRLPDVRRWPRLQVLALTALHLQHRWCACRRPHCRPHHLPAHGQVCPPARPLARMARCLSLQCVAVARIVRFLTELINCCAGWVPRPLPSSASAWVSSCASWPWLSLASLRSGARPPPSRRSSLPAVVS